MDKAGQTQDMKRLEAMPEAIINIQTVIRRLAPIHESLPNRYLGFKLEINEALAELEQAVRYLEGKEEPE